MTCVCPVVNDLMKAGDNKSNLPMSCADDTSTRKVMLYDIILIVNLDDNVLLIKSKSYYIKMYKYVWWIWYGFIL